MLEIKDYNAKQTMTDNSYNSKLNTKKPNDGFDIGIVKRTNDTEPFERVSTRTLQIF